MGERYGHPVCYVDFPDFTTADIQVSVQYLVYGLRREFRMAGRKVAVFGISQGGLLPRFALTYWPDLRRKVSDVLSAAGTHHGTTVSRGCSEAPPSANWQQLRGSNLLDALNAQPDETPGDVSYVCDHPYAVGLDEQQTSAFLDGTGGLVSGQQAQAPKVASEPKVRDVFKRRRG